MMMDDDADLLAGEDGSIGGADDFDDAENLLKSDSDSEDELQIDTTEIFSDDEAESSEPVTSSRPNFQRCEDFNLEMRPNVEEPNESGSGGFRVSPTDTVKHTLFKIRNQRQQPMPDLRQKLNVRRDNVKPTRQISLKPTTASRIQNPRNCIPMTKRPRVFFRGPEERLPLIGHLQNSFTKEVSNIKFEEEVIIEIDQDDDDDDDDIEVLEVVTHDQKIYKPIKKEDMTPHGAKSDPKDKPLIHSTGQLITVRFRKQFRQHRNELRYKDSLVPVHLLKGNINKPRFQKVKRTIENEEEEDQENEIECKKVKTNNFAVPTSLNTVLPKSVQNVQVQVSNLPKEWLESGTKRISSIAEAYGPPDEEVLESVNLLQDKSVVIVFKKDIFAYAFYESLHQREVYETMISVTEPSAECSIYSQTSVTN